MRVNYDCDVVELSW